MPTLNTREAIAARRDARRERLQEELDRMLARLKEDPSVRRVVLFGSLTRDDWGSRSDLDLIVIQDTRKPFLERLDEFYRRLTPRVETDILVYTETEWDELRQTRAFVKRAADEGVLLYESVTPR